MADYILDVCSWTTLGGRLCVGDFEWSTLHDGRLWVGDFTWETLGGRQTLR